MTVTAKDLKVALARVAWWGFGALMVALTLLTVQKMVLGRDGDLHSFFFHASRMLIDGSWRDHDPGAIAFTVLPVALVPIMLLALLPWLVAAVVWVFVSTGCLAASAVLSTRMAVERITGRTDLALTPVAAIIGVAVVMASILADLNLGQYDLVIAALLTAALWNMQRRPIACGVFLALAATIKMVGLLFVPWLLLRRAWVQATTCLVAFIVMWALAVPLLGVAHATEGLTSGFVGDGRLNVAMAHAPGIGESRSASAGLQRLVEEVDPHLIPWAMPMLVFVTGIIGLMLYRLARQPLFNRVLGKRPDLDLLEAACIPVLAIAMLPAGHIRHGCMAIVATCLLGTLLLTPGRRRGHIVLLVVMGVIVAGQAHLADALGLGHAWDVVGGFGWTMLLLVMALTWVTLDRITSSGPSETMCRA